MEAFVNLFYVEGNVMLTLCRLLAVVVSLEFISTVIYFLSKIGK